MTLSTTSYYLVNNSNPLLHAHPVPGNHEILDSLQRIDVKNTSPLHQIKVATYNRAHPIPTLIDMRTYQNDRFFKQNDILLSMTDVSFSQETTAVAFKDMIENYEGISPDYQSFEQLSYSPKPGKRAWTGLAIFFDPQKFELNGERNFRFKSYDDDCQKSWQEVGVAFTDFLANLFGSGLPPYQQGSSIRQSLRVFISSFSGPARTDGVLELHLRHIQSGAQFVMCTTHLESFEKKINAGQRSLFLELIQSIKAENPKAIIILGGDFNFELRNPVEHQGIVYESAADMLAAVLSAKSVRQDQLTPTHGSKVIDDIYVIPPSDHDLHLPIDLDVILEPIDYENSGLLSDHKVVLRRLMFDAHSDFNSLEKAS